MSEQIKSPPTLEELRARRDEILEITERYGVSNLRVFGSVARGEATPNSDVDFLVDFPPKFSLLGLSGLVQDLQALLECRVQVASAAHLREELRPYILPDVQAL